MIDFFMFKDAGTMGGDTSGGSDCSCLVGTAYKDVNGVCRCTDVNGVVPPLGVNDAKTNPFGPGGIYYIFNSPPASAPSTTGTTAGAAAGPTIFGLPANMVYIGGAIAAFFLLSKMDGGKTK